MPTSISTHLNISTQSIRSMTLQIDTENESNPMYMKFNTNILHNKNENFINARSSSSFPCLAANTRMDCLIKCPIHRLPKEIRFKLATLVHVHIEHMHGRFLCKKTLAIIVISPCKSYLILKCILN